MFKENSKHNQQQIYNSYTMLHPKIQNKLDQSWAPIFYEHVFCKIDEKPFGILYSMDKGRSNYPVNILLSLELIKHTFDYTDEILLDHYNFSYQVMFALGERSLGERYLAERTLYTFRRRIYQYTIEHPEQEDLIFGQFKELTNHFIKAARIDTREQRMDSTFFMSNIKLAGRLSLAYDVLLQAVKVCPEELLTTNLKEVLEPAFKTELLYRSRSNQVPGRLQELLNLSATLLELVKDPSAPELCLLQRFLNEQTVYDQKNRCWSAKENKDIAANSLQSAYDPDATYRNKGGRKNKGYTNNYTETCADSNPIQLVTDYVTKNSSVSDTELLIERLPDIKENTELTDLYVDGAYYGETVETNGRELKVNIHYTDMTGKAPSPEKISLTEFTIDEELNVLACPEDHLPLKSSFKKKNGLVTAHFQVDQCRQCPRNEQCPVKFQQKSAVLRVMRNAILAAHTRDRTLAQPLRKEAVSKRAAVEGSISALKRSQGADKLRVRTHPKVQVVTGFKMIGRNIRQLVRFFRGKYRRNVVFSTPTPAAVCTF